MPTDPVIIIAGLASLLALGLAAALYWRWQRRRRDRHEPAAAPERASDRPASGTPLIASNSSPEWGHLRAWLEAQPEVTLVHTEQVLFVNEAAAALLGGEPAELVGRQVIELIRPAYRAATRHVLAGLQRGEPAPERLEVQLNDAAGDGRWVELSCRQVSHQGKPALLTVARDIGYRRSMDAGLQRGKLQARMTLDSIGEGVITTDTEGHIDYLNDAAEALTGVSRASAIGRRLSDLIALVDEVDRKSLGDPVAKSLVERRRINLGRRALMLSKTGSRECSVELTASPIRDPGGQLSGCVVVLHDVTEIRGLTRQMSYQASHDALTGLLNRHEFQRRLEEALASARSEDGSHVLCYLDLDRFKAVNDTCGHVAGDNLLRELAALIRDEVRDSDSVARLGGDEFGMLLIGCPLEKACQIAEDVCQAVAAYRFVWQDKIFTVGVSVGLVQIGSESGTLEDVLSAADSACYVAKQQGRGRVHVYSARDEALARQRGEIQWLQKIQAALKEDRFELYTQSIISLGGRVTHGPAVEVLLRLRDEGGAVIAPGQFMASAERYHLMSHIDRWVVRTTLAALGGGVLKLPDQRSCSINLSGQTLGDEAFLEFVVECLDHSGVMPARVCFEIPEAAVIGNIDHARRFINVLHGMGCHFALDNFGSGMGSFANLKTLSLDYLKIDGIFTRELATDTVHQAMIGAVVELARTLQFKVVAEQIEDQAAFETLRRMGVDFAQGFVVERPRPLSERPAVSAR
jgi:diguanylate cyclase (GGDEF)-like protein/PAS domain S-box-containing protein